MFRLEKTAQVEATRAPHGFEPYPSQTISHSTKGYSGAASRSGYGSYFGDRERRWQEYEFARKHQAGPSHQPGAVLVILADEKGKGTAEIGGRMCTFKAERSLHRLRLHCPLESEHLFGGKKKIV